MEGDQGFTFLSLVPPPVSIHALTWRATLLNPANAKFLEVSIHALTWRATLRNGTDVLYRMFQSTPSHGGRLLPADASAPDRIVSIHALTWRATAVRSCRLKSGAVSIHALTWRATIVPLLVLPLRCVSIHALTWRATTLFLYFALTRSSFNPRPHMEGDNLGK